MKQHNSSHKTAPFRVFRPFCILCAIAFVCAPLLTACSAKSSGAGTAQSTGGTMRAYPMAAAKMEMAFDGMDMVVDEEAMADYGNATGPSVPTPSPAERKLIYTGYISLEVQSLADTKTNIEAWVKKYGGYISNTSESQNNVNFTVNVPQERFHEAMSETGAFGKIRNKNTNSRDVTEQFYDLQTRLDTRRVLLERLQTYLANAKDIQDLIQLEAKINDVTSELERMQGQMNRLQNQISYSQIEINAFLPVNQNSSGFILPDAKRELRIFLGNIASFFVNFLFVILYVFVYGVPIVLVLILLYWLAFGKVGLVRKLFDKARK